MNKEIESIESEAINHDSVPAPGIGSQILFYQREGGTRDTGVRLPQAMIANLFQTTNQNVILPIHTVYKEGEPAAPVKEYRAIQSFCKLYQRSPVTKS